MLIMLPRHVFWKTSSVWLIMDLVIFQDSAPHRSVLKTLLLNSPFLVFVAMFLALLVLLCSGL